MQVSNISYGGLNNNVILPKNNSEEKETITKNSSTAPISDNRGLEALSNYSKVSFQGIQHKYISTTKYPTDYSVIYRKAPGSCLNEEDFAESDEIISASKKILNSLIKTEDIDTEENREALLGSGVNFYQNKTVDLPNIGKATIDYSGDLTIQDESGNIYKGQSNLTHDGNILIKNITLKDGTIIDGCAENPHSIEFGKKNSLKGAQISYSISDSVIPEKRKIKSLWYPSSIILTDGTKLRQGIDYQYWYENFKDRK